MPETTTTSTASKPVQPGWINKFMQVSGHTPGVFPRAVSGPLLGTALQAGMGYGAGRYLGAPLLKYIMKETTGNDIDDEKARNVAGTLGALAGATPGAYLMYTGLRQGGLPGLVGGLSNWKNYDLPKKASVNSQEKRANSWYEPIVPYAVAQSTIDQAVNSGKLNIMEAANLAQINAEAKPQNSQWITPAGIARSAVSLGVGALAGRALGAMAGGIFGSLAPKTQQNLTRATGIGNLVFDAMGRLASQ